MDPMGTRDIHKMSSARLSFLFSSICLDETPQTTRLWQAIDLKQGGKQGPKDLNENGSLGGGWTNPIEKY